jgi:hypothetical protein
VWLPSSDPVAYRIEPLLLGQDQTVDAPSAMYLTVPGEDVRLHVKAMQLGDVVRKTLFEPKRSGTTSGWGTLAESLGRQLAENASSKSSSVEAGSKTLIFPLGGTSGRVDYCLQPGLIENEYIR